MTKITAKTALEAMRSIVKEFGADYVYPAIGDEECAYARGGAPSCIVGHIVARLDPDLFLQLGQMEDENGPFAIGSPEGHGNELRDSLGDAYQLLLRAQQGQDKGDTWGSVLESAEKFHAEEGN